MIPNHMITHFAKPLSKRTIANQGALIATKVWSNGFILFWEIPPAYAANHYAAEQRPILDTITLPDQLPPLWPLEIRYHDSTGNLYVRFSNGNGRTHWLNGNYLSTALKQANRQANNVTFAWCTAQAEGKAITGIVALLLDRPLALLAPLEEEYCPFDHAPDWQLLNEDIPTPFNPEPPKHIDPKTVTQATLF